MPFSFADIPDLTGKRAIVTGANSGLGLVTARELARHGATVVMACRNPDKAKAALEVVMQAAPKASVSVAPLDLMDLGSVEAFSTAMSSEPLHLLINNAGVMVPPLARTKQGFESQFGVNHLAHFALTGRLLPVLQKTGRARVVVVSSIAHKQGVIDFDDLNVEKKTYSPWAVYSQSKLANLMFGFELHRRLTQHQVPVSAVIAHPGVSMTNLQRTMGVLRHLVSLLASKPEDGALPQLFAATSPNAEPGAYYGPTGLAEYRGPVGKAGATARAKSLEDARRLWEVSEQLTGVKFLGNPKAAAAA